MSIICIGDPHYQIDKLNKILKQYPNDYKLILGDLGWGFGPIPIWDDKTFSIRGNHDDPKVAQAHPNYLGEFGYNEKLDIFYISGAWSIDYPFRTPGVDWWPTEELSYNQLIEMALLYEKVKPSRVISHDCPFSCYYGVIGITDTLIPNRTALALDTLLEIHRPKWFIHGHHHVTRQKTIQGTTFVCVPELGTFTLK